MSPSNLRHKAHTAIDCIPIPSELMTSAPGVFKKALVESDEEWSDNPKLIPTGKEKTLRTAIPKGFPYFHIEFGYKGQGWVHVIEDDTQFPNDFGLSIMASILGVAAGVVKSDGGRGKVTSADEAQRLKNTFIALYKSYAWC